MRILVVEDDELTAQALNTILSQHNYVVELARDGDAAWRLNDNFAYDLILLDVVLPKGDGITLCRRLRSQGYQMPILLLTGRDSSHDKTIGLDAGADDYVVKPFDPEELGARIRALMRRSGSTIQPILEWGALRLDPSLCEVSHEGKILPLTPKEYGLLELFLRHSHRVFSCGMILEQLWAFDEMPGEEAVRTHIKGLRQKLKASGAPADLVETVYGIGYRLKPRPDTGNGKVAKTPAPKVVSPAPAPAPGLSNGDGTVSHQQTLTAIAAVWNRFKGRVLEQIALLEQAADALGQRRLEPSLQEQAEREAHSLAGALGTFGFPDGSPIARQIEHRLATKVLHPEEAVPLKALIRDLRQAIGEPVEAPPPTPLRPSHDHPRLLIVERDRALIDDLKAAAERWGFAVTVVGTLNAARRQVQQQPPQLVVFDPMLSDNIKEGMAVLNEWHRQGSPVPVLVFTAHDNWRDRLEMARQGKQSFLLKPASADQVMEAATQLLQQSQQEQALSQSEARILMVDDDPKTLAILQALLTPWGFQLVALNDPRRFWETLESTQPDLLILDVKMPHISGFELCQLVRNDVRWAGLPILFLTAYSDAATIHQVFTVGADDFISKPIVGPELVTRIVNRLERTRYLRYLAAKSPVFCAAAMQDSAEAAATHDSEAKTALQKSYSEIELRVAERTAELVSANHRLHQELEERRRIEDVLRIAQARFAGILEIADDAIISVDAQQRITLFNQGAEKIFGYTAQEVLQRPLDILLPYRFAHAHRQHIDQFGHAPRQARRMGERSAIYGRRKNGTEFPAEASISRLGLGNETVFTVILRDISDRKHAEDELQRLSRQNELILNSMGEGLCGLDVHGKITVVNPAASRLLGYEPDALIYQPIQLILPTTNPDGTPYEWEESPIYLSLRNGVVHPSNQGMFRRPDGSTFPVDYMVTPIVEQQHLIGAVLTFRDVSDRRLVERMKDEFISIVSHELRTPLTSIHGSLRMLTSGLLQAESERGQRLLHIAVDSTDRLMRLINDILDIERIESGKVAMEKQSCDAANLLQKAAEVMQAMAEKFDVTLSVHAVSVPLVVDGDRVIQVLTNLLSNAVKFSPTGGTVQLTTQLTPDPMADETPDEDPPTVVLFSVSDEGRGIPADKLYSIFERFQQVDASDSRNHDGTGLGLAICRSIVEQHDGKIWVESTLGEGSTFYFTLPLPPS